MADQADALAALELKGYVIDGPEFSGTKRMFPAGGRFSDVPGAAPRIEVGHDVAYRIEKRFLETAAKLLPHIPDIYD
jgi:hypothetical protein